MSYSYVALDVETANSFRGSICSIGLVKFQDGEVIDSFYSLINPEEEFDEFNIFIHGIMPDDVIGSPTFPEIRQKIVDFIGTDIVVAHFAQFDMGALKDAYQKYHLEFDNIEYICSYRLAKAALPGQLNYKLKRLAKNLNLELDHHNALSDAQACGFILEHILSTNSFSELDTFLKEFRYDKTGLLGQRSFKRRKDARYKENLIYQPTEEEKAAMNPDHYFYGLYFCFTGKLERMTRKEANKAVALVGGIPEKGVTQRTNILVVGEQDWRVVGTNGLSSKMKKAQSLLEKGQDIEIMTENDFIKFLEPSYDDDDEYKEGDCSIPLQYEDYNCVHNQEQKSLEIENLDNYNSKIEEVEKAEIQRACVGCLLILILTCLFIYFLFR
ncbi:exonuclease domain-containing protein [Streptococcus pyogenes]|uniref:exonuclease domain-containing protein n=1 Tax=Streptococcus pyogenes TaxID=1314 RepID=UPI0010F06591|nr:exonuclease domain-containing protein [Streptococcus pyogenes]VGR78926.1 Exonuclease [Streptococcus pyogenes]VGR79315.1 Exonuclease [Streptococcus pyogenes]VGS04558.1 Exonuclease [Streptococcus pyogenes]VGS06495.1 Exonuclease [Streptococcus pyogenes]VGS08244.1 Exonuclease [Streptococcus pyogenes]